jgi:hypothetical protein
MLTATTIKRGKTRQAKQQETFNIHGRYFHILDTPAKGSNGPEFLMISPVTMLQSNVGQRLPCCI